MLGSPKAASGLMCFARSKMKLAKAAPPMVPPGAISGRPGNFPEEKVKAKGEICFSEEI